MPEASNHLVFVWKTSGYEIAEREGDPPVPGSEVEDGEQRFVVVRVGPSPKPADERRCAYLQPV